MFGKILGKILAKEALDIQLVEVSPEILRCVKAQEEVVDITDELENLSIDERNIDND